MSLIFSFTCVSATASRSQRTPVESSAAPAPNTPSISNELIITAANVQLLLIAPDGKRTGYDPKTKKQYRAIPESGYFQDALPAYDTGRTDLSTTQTINVQHPAAGKYRLIVSGGSAPSGESFDVRVKIYRNESSKAGKARIAGTIKSGVPNVYELQLRMRDGSATVVVRPAAVSRRHK